LVVGNALDWQPSVYVDVWHDRAAVHFLAELADQEAYIQVMERVLASGGRAIIGEFGSDNLDKRRRPAGHAL
jgi:ubiquinone/menaquinone biosynthesis C-methylase UbiE